MALLSFGAGLMLAWHHPVWPAAALVFFYVVCIGVAWWPGVWLLIVPAGLPWLDFSPWTGWLIFDEFDLLLLAVFAGAYGRLAWPARNSAIDRVNQRNACRHGQSKTSDTVYLVLLAALGVLGIVGLWRGFHDAGGFTFGWFQSYTDPLNSFRVFKSLLFAILTVPLLRHEMRLSKQRTGNRLALGMVLGLATVSLAALWERAAYPGVFDFSTVYRITALFWEMHVGGGAIDAYLALSLPFVLWALVSSRRPLSWVLSAVLALLAVYACLTTFSRGVYLAVALPLVWVVLAWLSQLRSTGGMTGPPTVMSGAPTSRRRTRVNWSLGLAIAALVGGVLVGGTLGMGRFGKTERDFDSRLARWQQGIGLLNSTSGWLLGLGLGRLPANYAQRVPGSAGEFSGRVQIHEHGSETAPGRPYVTIFGPATRPDLSGLFALTQRVDIHAGGGYRVSMDIRAPAGTGVWVQLCERHLLYDWRCQDAFMRTAGAAGHWQHWVAQLSGDELGRGPWYAPRLGMLGISVLDQGAKADFDNLALVAADRKELLANGDFAGGLAQWFPAAQYYFLPWHIDNVYLEVLIERGISGLSVFGVLVLWALVRLASEPRKAACLSPYLAASLCGALLVGMVNSIMDVPRVAFLLLLLVLFALELTRRSEPSSPCTASPIILGGRAQASR